MAPLSQPLWRQELGPKLPPAIEMLEVSFSFGKSQLVHTDSHPHYQADLG